jgi:uncharacterized protein YjiS (DUF1127 family)
MQEARQDRRLHEIAKLRLARARWLAEGEAARPRFVDALRGTTSLLAALGRLMLAWDARYRQRRRLAELPDERLADIGLSRRDAAAEAERPPWSGHF